MTLPIHVIYPVRTGILWFKKKYSLLTLFLLFFIFLGGKVCAQTQVFQEQGVQFGTFVSGSSGGVITINYEGERTSTGSIILINQGDVFQPVVFGIDAPLGTIITLLKGPDVTLQGANGGKIILSLGTSDRGSYFVSTAVPPNKNYVAFTTTLTVGTIQENPSGSYSGILSITVMKNLIF
jgi:hypothetical protein